MANADGRTRARLAVHAELAHREWNTARLASESSTDPGTISDFLSGVRWPKAPTKGKIERALAWPPGTIEAIAAGMDSPSVGGVPQDVERVEEDDLLYRRPEGYSDETWERIRNESREFIEWQLDRASKER